MNEISYCHWTQRGNMLPLRTKLSAKLTFSFILFVVFLSTSTADKNSSIIDTRSTAGSTASCICVPYYYCDSDNMIITNGQGLIEIRNSRSSSALGTICEEDLEICCRLPESVENSSRCGRRRANVHLLPWLDKDAANEGEFPWMVTIFRKKIVQQKNETMQKKVYQCQGTLISEQVVLTAAQCVKQSGNETEPLSIRAGQTDTMMSSDELVYQERDVDKVLIPKNYHPIRLRGNVALLVLQKPLRINRHVDITCLADETDIIDGDKCLVIGWDKFLSAEDTQNQRSQTNLLKRRLEPLMPRDTCTSILRKTPFGKRFTLPACSICAGGPSGKNFCSREIGGSLACPLKNHSSRYVQVGITSWCINAGNLPTPSIFTSVIDTRKWIDEQMTKLNIDNSVYRATNIK